ncbi:AraC family transcriptional regulator [Devosia nitrariae]|uniref:Cupin n=1 Tax=Devosia nitrariae TaxID=2071872 RepID=A0ABQ5W191_9HYPH|nr:AraC family transcriptional regulator [Devosia nitrariae]GLQ53685.1 cupin [Devosia nitrariae]
MTETSDFLTEKPGIGEAVPGPSGTDVLSEILRVFRVTGAALLRAEFSAPWGCDNPPASAVASLLHPGATRLIIFHIVAEGTCWIEVDGEERRVLHEGDIVGLPHGHAHRMGSGEVELVPIASLFPPAPWAELPVLIHGGDGAPTRIVCIYLHCDLLLFGPFLASLPTLLVVRREEGPSGQWFDANMRYLVAEAVRGRPGASCLMARLTELLFIEILRRYMAQLRAEDVGWLAALNDRYACRALNAFHSRPAESWTVEMLAREAGLSRSALVRRFHRLLSMSPIRYVATWRLHLAAQAVRDGSETIATIAEQAGFGSEEAFSRAFKRCFGSSPSAWRRSRTRVA